MHKRTVNSSHLALQISPPTFPARGRGYFPPLGFSRINEAAAQVGGEAPGSELAESSCWCRPPPPSAIPLLGLHLPLPQAGFGLPASTLHRDAFFKSKSEHANGLGCAPRDNQAPSSTAA